MFRDKEQGCIKVCEMRDSGMAMETVMTLNKLGSMRKDGKSHPCHLPGFK